MTRVVFQGHQLGAWRQGSDARCSAVSQALDVRGAVALLLGAGIASPAL